MKKAGKLYYSIGEVCELLGLEPHVLRYWEREFKQLRPKRGPAGRRLYREQDVVVIRSIRELLHEEGYSVAGARRRLAEFYRKDSDERLLARTREGLQKILNILDEDSPGRLT